MLNNLVKKSRYSFFTTIVLLACSSVNAANNIDNESDNILHTTIFHNKDHKTLRFLVTFGMGYGDANNCNIVKQRVFTATHPDGFHAHNYGKHLAKEFGPALFTCVNERLHVIDSQYPDESAKYALKNNGKYYTKAIPDTTDVYPK